MLWFLASPYTNYAYGHEAAFQQVRHVTAKLLSNSIAVYSPIAYSHQFVSHGLPITAADWVFLNDEMTRVCDGCIIYLMLGWDTSTGVKRELDSFTAQNKPIECLRLNSSMEEFVKTLKRYQNAEHQSRGDVTTDRVK